MGHLGSGGGGRPLGRGCGEAVDQPRDQAPRRGLNRSWRPDPAKRRDTACSCPPRTRRNCSWRFPRVWLSVPAGRRRSGSGAIVVFVLVGGLQRDPSAGSDDPGRRSSPDRLGSARVFLQKHNAAVTAVVLGVLGLWLLVGDCSNCSLDARFGPRQHLWAECRRRRWIEAAQVGLVLGTGAGRRWPWLRYGAPRLTRAVDAHPAAR